MKCDIKVVNRLKRVEGQMRGVISMMEKELSCTDIITQLKAIRSSIDRTINVLATNNLIEIIESTNNVKLDNIEEALNLIIKNT